MQFGFIRPRTTLQEIIMTEEEFNQLLVVIEAKINELIGDHLGRDTLHEAVRFSELRQDFINTFIFGEKS